MIRVSAAASGPGSFSNSARARTNRTTAGRSPASAGRIVKGVTRHSAGVVGAGAAQPFLLDAKATRAPTAGALGLASLSLVASIRSAQHFPRAHGTCSVVAQKRWLRKLANGGLFIRISDFWHHEQTWRV